MTPEQVGPEAFAAVARRLASRMRKQSATLLSMAEAVVRRDWADWLAQSAEWVRIEAEAKRDVDIMVVLLRGLEAGSLREALKIQGLTAEQAAAIAGLGGTDGWD